MIGDKGHHLPSGRQRQPAAVPQPSDELAVIDGKAPKGGLRHFDARRIQKGFDLSEQISSGHVGKLNGLLPTCQWAIAQVTPGPRVGNVPLMESGWRKKLDEAMVEKGFNKKSLSLAAGLGETYVRDLLLRDRTPGLEKASKLARVLGKPIVDIFGDILEGADEADDSCALPAPSVTGFISIGRFDASFSMGPGSLIADHPEPLGYWVFEEQWLRALSSVSPDRLAVVKVDGDSMMPTLHNGDLVLVDRTRTRPNREGIYALQVGDIAWVKRVSVNLKTQKIRVLSDNPLVPKQPEMNEDELIIIGRVIALVARKVP